MSESKGYPISIPITLFLTPVLYLAFLKVFLKDIFNDEAVLTMLLLYIGPFWFLLMFIIAVELYRRILTGGLRPYQSVWLLMTGSVMVNLVGLLINPVNPGFFTKGVLIVFTGGLLISALAGLFVNWLVRHNFSFRR